MVKLAAAGNLAGALVRNCQPLNHLNHKSLAERCIATVECPLADEHSSISSPMDAVGITYQWTMIDRLRFFQRIDNVSEVGVAGDLHARDFFHLGLCPTSHTQSQVIPSGANSNGG